MGIAPPRKSEPQQKQSKDTIDLGEALKLLERRDAWPVRVGLFVAHDFFLSEPPKIPRGQCNKNVRQCLVEVNAQPARVRTTILIVAREIGKMIEQEMLNHVKELEAELSNERG